MTLKSRDKVIEDVKNIGAFFILPVAYGLEKVISIKHHCEDATRNFIEKKTAVSRYCKLIEKYGFPDLNDFLNYCAGDALFLDKYRDEPELFPRLMKIRRRYFDEYRGKRIFQSSKINS